MEQAKPELSNRKVEILDLQQATRLLHQFFGFSHGSNPVLKLGEAIYRNIHGQHKIPENFADSDKAPKVIANYAFNKQTHTDLTAPRESGGRPLTPEDVLITAVIEAKFFQETMQSTDNLTSFDIWRHSGREDFDKPIFAEPELEVIRIMVTWDLRRINNKKSEPVFLPKILDPSQVKRLPVAQDLFKGLKTPFEQTPELLQKMVDDESADDEDRNIAYDYLKMFRRVLNAIEKKSKS